MKQQGDIRTVEIFPLPARRGRPPTGNAKTGAEREAKRRQKMREVAAAEAAELAALRVEVELLRSENAKLAEYNGRLLGRLVKQYGLRILTDEKK
jgi:hypothetical protein